ncbi:unnamed protein product [Sphagnum balticum]
MHLRFFTALSVSAAIFLTAELAFSQTEDALNAELNAAEGAAGGNSPSAPPPKELKSDGDTLDAIGIPTESGAPLGATPAPPPPKVAQPSKPAPQVKAPPPEPIPTPIPEPTVKEEIPAPGPAEEIPPPAATTENKDEPAPEVDTLQVEAPAPEAVPVAEKQGQNDESEQKICNCRFKPGTPYRTRRPNFTGIFAIDAGTYAPTNFVSKVISSQTLGSTPSYSGLYGGGASPNFDITFGAKYNFLLGSVGLQLSGGYFSATNQNVNSTLSVTPITLGAVYYLDSIFQEPYVVPYFIAGLYTDIWKEVSQGLSINGRTGFAPFYAVGLNFQLDWIDVETHETGYRDFGLENTFLFVEARSFLSSNDIVDLSTGLQVSGGFKFEF